MKNEDEKKVFSTKDLSLVTTLLTLRYFTNNVDYQIEGERQQPVAYFSFEETPELKQTVQDFWEGKLAVEPRTFMFNLRAIKAQINSVYKSPRTDPSSFKTEKSG